MVIVIINLLGLFIPRTRIKGGLTDEREKEREKERGESGKGLLFLPVIRIKGRSERDHDT